MKADINTQRHKHINNETLSRFIIIVQGPETEYNLRPSPQIWKSSEDESTHSQGRKNKLLIKANRAFLKFAWPPSPFFLSPIFHP